MMGSVGSPGMLRDIRGSCSDSARIPCLRQEMVIRVET